MITNKPIIKKENLLTAPKFKVENKSIEKSEVMKSGGKPCCVEDYLSRQIDHEIANEQLYLAMSIWCTNNGYYETAKFFNEQSLEERSHGIQFINFMAKRGMKVHVPKNEEIPTEFDDIKDIMKKSLEREIGTTKMISELHQEALKTSDPVLTIAEAILKEQIEEEQLYLSLVNLAEMCNGSKIDFEMEISNVRGGKYKIGEI